MVGGLPITSHVSGCPAAASQARCASHWEAPGMPVCPGKFWGAGKEATSRQVGQESKPAASEHAQCCPVAGSDSSQTQNLLSSVLVNLDVLVEG